MYQLFGRAGWGSVLIEAQLAWYGLPFAFEEMDDLFTSESARAKLAKVNPLSQVPTLVLPDGQVMTESAAITLHLADVTRQTALVPPPGDPARFVTGEVAQTAFRKSVDAYAIRLWRMVEGEVAGPWFLGSRFSAMDIYIAVMTRWRPRRDWFAANLPRLTAVAQAVDQEPRLAEVWKRNFPMLLPPEEAP